MRAVKTLAEALREVGSLSVSDFCCCCCRCSCCHQSGLAAPRVLRRAVFFWGGGLMSLFHWRSLEEPAWWSSVCARVTELLFYYHDPDPDSTLTDACLCEWEGEVATPGRD